jgi:hypothetical protein
MRFKFILYFTVLDEIVGLFNTALLDISFVNTC